MSINLLALRVLASLQLLEEGESRWIRLAPVNGIDQARGGNKFLDHLHFPLRQTGFAERHGDGLEFGESLIEVGHDLDVGSRRIGSADRILLVGGLGLRDGDGTESEKENEGLGHGVAKLYQ